MFCYSFLFPAWFTTNVPLTPDSSIYLMLSFPKFPPTNLFLKSLRQYYFPSNNPRFADCLTWIHKQLGKQYLHLIFISTLFKLHFSTLCLNNLFPSNILRNQCLSNLSVSHFDSMSIIQSHLDLLTNYFTPFFIYFQTIGAIFAVLNWPLSQQTADRISCCAHFFPFINRIYFFNV